MTRRRKTKGVSKSAFARECGVSPSAITKACKHALRPALVGDRIDKDHPAAIEYREKKRGNGKANGHANGHSASNGTTHDVEPDVGETHGNITVHREDNLGSYADMTVRQLVEQFGTERAFKDWLEAHSKIEDVEQKRIRNQERRGELVSRDLVARTVFSAWEDSHRRLLSDIPRTLVARLYANAHAEVEKEQSEEMVRDLISGVLRAVKDTAEKALEPKG